MAEKVEQSPPRAALYVLNKVRVSLKRVQTALYPLGPLRKQIVLHLNMFFAFFHPTIRETYDKLPERNNELNNEL